MLEVSAQSCYHSGLTRASTRWFGLWKTGNPRLEFNYLLWELSAAGSWHIHPSAGPGERQSWGHGLWCYFSYPGPLSQTPGFIRHAKECPNSITPSLHPSNKCSEERMPEPTRGTLVSQCLLEAFSGSPFSFQPSGCLSLRGRHGGDGLNLPV